MGLFSKLKFWGKKDDLGFDKDLGLDLGPLPGEQKQGGADPFSSMPGAPDMGPPLDQPAPIDQPAALNQQPFNQSQQPFPSPEKPAFEPVKDSPESQMTLRHLEVISYKLDALQAILNGINERLKNLEAKEENKYRFKY